jgi:hypothetical protein
MLLLILPNLLYLSPQPIKILEDYGLSDSAFSEFDSYLLML